MDARQAFDIVSPPPLTVIDGDWVERQLEARRRERLDARLAANAQDAEAIRDPEWDAREEERLQERDRFDPRYGG